MKCSVSCDSQYLKILKEEHFVNHIQILQSLYTHKFLYFIICKNVMGIKNRGLRAVEHVQTNMMLIRIKLTKNAKILIE